MSVKTVAVVIGAMMIAGPALADCKDDLRELNAKIADFKAQAPIGSELRKLRAAAITFDRLGRGDACEETVTNIKSLIDAREERREERRENREEMERYTQAVAVGNLPGILRASTVQGLDVVNIKGEELGVVEDVAIDSTTGKIAYVVLSTVGLSGLAKNICRSPGRRSR